jgi:hypothetical protein
MSTELRGYTDQISVASDEIIAIKVNTVLDLDTLIAPREPGAALVVSTAGRTPICGMFLADQAELPRWRAPGGRSYLLESDHTFLLRGPAALAARQKSAQPKILRVINEPSKDTYDVSSRSCADAGVRW